MIPWGDSYTDRQQKILIKCLLINSIASNFFTIKAPRNHRLSINESIPDQSLIN